MHGAITLQRQISSMNYGFWIINARCIVRMSYFRKLLYNRWHKGSLKGHGSTKSEAVAAVLTDDPGPWCGWKLMKDWRGPQHRIAAACRRSGFCAACDPGLTKQSHSCWTRWRQAGVTHIAAVQSRTVLWLGPSQFAKRRNKLIRPMWRLN